MSRNGGSGGVWGFDMVAVGFVGVGWSSWSLGGELFFLGWMNKALRLIGSRYHFLDSSWTFYHVGLYLVGCLILSQRQVNFMLE